MGTTVDAEKPATEELAALREINALQQRLLEQQADAIDLLERALAAPGVRGRARLKRSPWPRRLFDRLAG